ncbi:transmembrane [Cyclospora cayetanensis]|uniref:Transmembrane n=1 Tax=Cyclospora cayetanensis TaxID=88456 RepID=A0A1D3D4S0_9EIME|nr:transmembrane [Cyclospora cayetanensis]
MAVPAGSHAHSLDVKDIVQMAQSVSEVSSSTSPPDGSVGFDAGASPPTSAFGGDSRDAVGGQASGEGGPPILALPRSSSPEHDAVGLEAAVTPDDPASKQLQELLLGSGTNTSGNGGYSSSGIREDCSYLKERPGSPPTRISLGRLADWSWFADGASRLHRLALPLRELGPLSASLPVHLQTPVLADDVPLLAFFVVADSPLTTLRLLLFTGSEASDECQERRDITATGSIYTYVSLGDARNFLGPPEGFLGAASADSLFVYVVCSEPCKPHLTAHLNSLSAADTNANKIRCAAEGTGGGFSCSTVSGRASRHSAAHFVLHCTQENGCFRNPGLGEGDILELTLSKKQQVATSSDLQVSSPFVLLAAWDCVPQTVTEVEDKWYDGSSEEDSEEAAAGAQCETIGPQGTIGGTVYLSARAKKDGVLHVLVHLRAYMKASQDFILSVGAPTAITAVSMEQSLDIIMPENSLRLFSFKFEESAFDPAAYCTPQLVPQREGKDKYHPFLVTAFALDGEPPGIACCNASRETHPDPALVGAAWGGVWRACSWGETVTLLPTEPGSAALLFVIAPRRGCMTHACVGVLQSTKEQPECWRTNEAEYNGLVALRVRTDHRRAQAPYGEFICGVRSREASHALFRLTLSSESSKQDPRLFEILDIDNVTFLSLIPYSQSCHYEHAAFSTDKSGGPLTLKLTKQKGPSPAETCVFPCQSALTPLAICSGLPLPNTTPPGSLCAVVESEEDDTVILPLPRLIPDHFYAIRFRLSKWNTSVFSLLLHRQSAADAHVSSVMLHNGVPFFARLQGDWHGGRAFRFGKVDGREGYKAPPIASEAGETGDLSCTLMVTQAHLKDLEAADSPLAFHLSLVTSDTLTDAYVFPPGATVPYTFDANRLTPLSAVIRLERKHAESALQVDPEKAVGLWKILFSTATKDSPVSLQITASVGALADGSVRVHRSPKLQVIESRAQHLMDGVHVAEDISADPSDPNHRKIFIFPLTFSLELAGGVPVESAMRCAATRFGATSVRLFANAVTWGDTEVPKGFKAFPAEAYKLPLPEDPSSIYWPAASQRSIPSVSVLEMLEQGEGSTQLGLEAAYVIVAEGFNSTHAANPVAPDPENRGPSLPETKAPNTAAAAQAAAATPTDAQYDKFSITCSFLRHAIPLAIGEPAEGFLGPEEERLFVLQVLNLSKDIILTLTSGAVGDAGMYVGARRDVSNRHPETVLFYSDDIGDDLVYISRGSPLFRKHCNRRVVEAHGACTFYVLVTAAQPSKFTLTADIDEDEVTFIPLGRSISGVLQPKRHKTFVFANLKQQFDYRVTLNVESGADAFVAVEKAANLRDLTPLSEGSAQWWTDGLASPDIKIHHTKVALQQRALSCTFPDSQAEVAVTEQVSQATKVSQALDLCVLRIDVASPVPQPFSITLDGSHSSAIPVTPIASGAPVRGVLHRGSTDYFRIDLHPTLIETDEDAALKIALESTGCGVSLSLRWPDGEVKAWPYPDNRQIIVTRRARPWTEGFFLLLVRGCVPPLCSGSLVMSTLALCLFASSCRPVGYARKFVVSWPFKANIYSPVAPIKAVHAPSLESAEMCSYELLAKIEASASESPPARVLRTGFPVRGTIRAGIPERFVWSPSVVSEKADAFANELLTLRATSVTHSIDVYAARLQPEQGFPQQPPPGSDPPPGVFKLQPYSDDPNTLYLNIGHAWALVGSEDFETACAPSNLREAKGLKGGMSDEDGPLQSVASCQLLISVFDRHAQEQDMPRDVDFTLVATSRLKDYFIQCAFEEPLDLVLQMFLQTNGVKVLLLSLDNVSADVSLRLTSSDAKLIKEMSAWLDYSESLLSPYSEKRCVLPDRSEMCWKGKSYLLGDQGITDIDILAERRAVHLRRLLYVVIRVETKISPGHEPLLQFVARQQGNFIPLRDNHDEAVYSVEAKAPKFFSFETTWVVAACASAAPVATGLSGGWAGGRVAGGYLIVSLDVDIRSVSYEQHGRFKKAAQDMLQSLSVFVQSCNNETFGRSMWSSNLRPSASLYTDTAYLNEYNQLVAVVENNMHQYNSPVCQYRIGVYSTSPSPVFFRMRASLQHQSTARVLPLGLPMLGYISRKPQMKLRRAGSSAFMFIADYFAIRVWKPANKSERLLLSVQACSGGVGFGWGTNKVQVRIQAEKNPWFLGTLKSIERSQTQEILAKQGLISLVVPSSSLNYVGASVRAASHYRSEGFTGGKSSSFSIRIDPLDSVICLGAENIDVNWRLRTATWLPRLWGEESKRLTADIWWSPLMAVPAVETVIESSSDSGDWGCASHDVAVRGSAVPPDSVEYELFVAKTDKVQGNWLSSCGMYQDTFLLGAAEKISIPEGVLAYSLDLDFESGSGYRSVGLCSVCTGCSAFNSSRLPSDGLELTRTVNSSYGPVPITIGCVDEGPMHEGDPVDVTARVADLPGMGETPWLFCDRS